MSFISPDNISGASLADLVACASESRSLDREEAARLSQDGGPEEDDTLQTLVRTHLRIAVDEAIRNRGLGKRQDHLARAGALALVRAAPDFDPEEHGSFSRYARRVVRDAIKDALVS